MTKIIHANTDIIECFLEIEAHLLRNKETAKGNKEAEILLAISAEIYELRSMNLSYNEKIEFSFQCDSNSAAQLFQVH